MTKQRVLIPLDSSEFSKSISDEICHLFLPKQYKLEFLRVANPPEPSWKELRKRASEDDWILNEDWMVVAPSKSDTTVDKKATPDTISEQITRKKKKLEESLNSELATVANYFQDKGFEVETSIRFGKASDEIIRFAEKEQVDLIAMATHARTGLNRMRLGSVAQEVLKNSHIPVLMVRPVARTAKRAAAFSTAKNPSITVS